MRLAELSSMLYRSAILASYRFTKMSKPDTSLRGRERRRFFRCADRHHALARFFHTTSIRKQQEELDMKNQPKKTLTKDYGFFVVRVSVERSKLIEELMSPEAKQATGLNKLTEQELA